MKLSLIVATYNVQDYILRCLQSLANQKMEDVEFLIVDDGSTDQTGQYIQDFIEKKCDSRFSYFKKKNGGQSSARNFGQKRATGDYIWYIDGDDYIEDDPELLEKLYENANQSGLDLLIFNFKYDKSWNTKYAGKLGFSDDESTIESGIFYIKDKNLGYSVWNYLFKREFLIQRGIFFINNSTAEDLNYVARVLLEAKKVKYIPVVAYAYVYRENSTTKSSSKEKIVRRINDVIQESENIDSKLRSKNINNGNSLISGYIAQALMACATGYVFIPRKKMRLFFKGKDLSLKEKIKVLILIYLPKYLRKKVCEKIIL